MTFLITTLFKSLLTNLITIKNKQRHSNTNFFKLRIDQHRGMEDTRIVTFCTKCNIIINKSQQQASEETVSYTHLDVYKRQL